MNKLPRLPKDIRFRVPKSGNKKYVAEWRFKDGKPMFKTSFGDRRYQHYKDRVPKSKGGGKWSKLDHLDSKRRQEYRLRHAGIKAKNSEGEMVQAVSIRHSPAWYSYHFLW